MRMVDSGCGWWPVGVGGGQWVWVVTSWCGWWPVGVIVVVVVVVLVVAAAVVVVVLLLLLLRLLLLLLILPCMVVRGTRLVSGRSPSHASLLNFQTCCHRWHSFVVIAGITSNGPQPYVRSGRTYVRSLRALAVVAARSAARI